MDSEQLAPGPVLAPHYTGRDASYCRGRPLTAETNGRGSAAARRRPAFVYLSERHVTPVDRAESPFIFGFARTARSWRCPAGRGSVDLLRVTWLGQR